MIAHRINAGPDSYKLNSSLTGRPHQLRPLLMLNSRRSCSTQSLPIFHRRPPPHSGAKSLGSPMTTSSGPSSCLDASIDGAYSSAKACCLAEFGSALTGQGPRRSLLRGGTAVYGVPCTNQSLIAEVYNDCAITKAYQHNINYSKYDAVKPRPCDYQATLRSLNN
ncbi:hypothetical protein ASPTUDRAFT_336440 [Aspergillus tubingensis CBS 134.48]|uniref:Uncharacterized protein n=1 Tax=Aspergillus tubingensis (strain CBS 134.48) TaxID=767770 RepID=A0A1L9NKH0_ASPTC|nr:hypothetical protein ASPTUDRAFT_336440 [Aspergillus tubingensis CBS 134.48]